MNFLIVALLLLSTICIQFVHGRCPNWCNKRGECTSPAEGGYCVCHYGFTGEDCSQRLCPAGFDPVELDSKTNRRTVRMEVGHMGGIMMGKYSFSFAGSEVYLPAHANDNDEAKCNNALKGLTSVSSALCKRESFNPNTGTGTYLISLLGFPINPHMNNIIHHNGNPGINLFSCNVSKIDNEEAQQPFCFVSDTEPNDGFPLYAECANHGACDRITGTCTCERGFNGKNCIDMKDNEDIVEHIHDGPYFTASVVKINAKRSPSAEFNLLQAQIDGMNVTTLQGDRLLQHNGDMQVAGTFALGVQHNNNAQDTLGSANIKSVIGNSVDEPKYHILAYQHNERSFSVSSSGDAQISGTLHVNNGSLQVENSLISGQSLRLENDLHVQGSANVEESLTIGAGFALTPGGMTVDVASHSGTLFELRSRQVGFNGTLMELNSMGDNNVILKTVSSGMTTFELHSSGDVRMNGLHLASGGIQVQAGGIEVEAGGIAVQGGMSIFSGGLTLEQQDFNVGSLHAQAGDENLREPLISASSMSNLYSGEILSLSASAAAASTSTATSLDGSEPISFLHFQLTSDLADPTDPTDPKHADTNSSAATAARSVFRVRGSGQLESAAGAVFRGNAGVDVHGSTTLRGKMRFERAVLTPSRTAEGVWTVHVPTTATYSVISALTHADDAKISAVQVIFDGNSDNSATAGRVVLLTNLDKQPTTGEASIPPLSTVMMLFDGVEWVSVDALKAPMHELKHVRMLEAANDLNIGNFTLSALRFQATGLHKNAVVFASAEGFLGDSDKFTYTKGALSVPAIRVDKILSDIDVRGNDLSNAQLTNPKMTGALISATEVTIPGKTGLAYFTSKGDLSASSSLCLDENGHLLITDTYADINAHGHEIRNIQIHSANLSNVGSIHTRSLYLTGSEGDADGGLLLTRSGGRVVSARSAITVNIETGNVAVKSLHAAALSGSMDAHDHVISNVNIRGGSLAEISSVVTEQATVASLRSRTGGSGPPRLVFADANGKLQAQNDANHAVLIPQLTVDELTFSTPEIDFHGKKLKNVILDSDTFVLGPQKSLKGEEVVISKLEKTLTEGNLLTADADGKIGAFAGMSIRNGILDIATRAVSASSVRAQTLSLSSIKSAPFLSTDGDGNLIAGTVLEADSIKTKQSLTITTKAAMNMLGRESNTLLSVNSKGEVVTVQRPPVKGSDASLQSSPSVDAHLRDMRAVSAAADNLAVQKASIGELYMIGDQSGISSGSVLTQNKAGRVSAADEQVLRIEKGSVLATSLRPADSSVPLNIASALLTRSNISASHVHNAISVSTATLSVSEIAEFLSDVVIDGTVTVHGSVVGSGPYVDSSDARLKQDVVNITDALDAVCSLRGVKYNFKTEGVYSPLGLPNTTQIGFIAQEVENIFPELVTQSATRTLVMESGEEVYTKGVAYAHMAPLLAEAIKELRAQHDAELAALRNEVKELKDLVKQLLDLKSN